MNYYNEKIFFGTTNLIGAFFATLGAMMTYGDARWIFVTLVVGIITSTSMALMTRKDENMKIVVGRFLFAVVATVLGTRVLSHSIASLAIMNDDIIFLGAIAGAVNVFAFTVGYGLIRSLNDERISLGRWLKDLLLTILTKK